MKFKALIFLLLIVITGCQQTPTSDGLKTALSAARNDSNRPMLVETSSITEALSNEPVTEVAKFLQGFERGENMSITVFLESKQPPDLAFAEVILMMLLESYNPTGMETIRISLAPDSVTPRHWDFNFRTDTWSEYKP